MQDIVLDTCILAHADNPDSGRQDESLQLITRMYANTTAITVDTGFSLAESKNKSFIGFEYINNLPPSSLGYTLIKDLALNLRINFVSNVPPYRIKKYIEKIIRNKKDRMFLRVAYNSFEKTLVSHDFTDFQVSKRVKIRRDLNTVIVTATEIIGSL